jgi:poly(A) polymerase
VYFFFVVYAQWKWPQPVALTPIYIPPSDFELPVWGEFAEFTVNSTGQTELTVSGHVMPIITPVFPAHNATANVSESTLKVSSPLRALCPAHARTH